MSSENNNIRNLYIGLGVIVLVIALVTLLNSLFNVASKASMDEGVAEHFAAATDKRIEPVGTVNAGDVNKVVVLTAKEIVEGTCAACHGTGAMGAPKIGNKGQWAPRGNISQLLKSAISGKGMMPARGGNASLTDADLKKAIQYMLKKSGL